ncbi:MAG: OmpA family protein [Bacteroidetes bacterium]|nr:OmpA family protein [Bacteroidota bacterium]
MTLSQKRTESVKTYLMGKGIMESRLTATGFGESKPIADNAKADGRAKNRRVELKTEY